MKSLYCATMSLFLFSGAAIAGVWYVSPSGNDGAAGDGNHPLKTPHAALNKMAAGDTVYLGSGTYTLNEQVKPGKSGTADNRCKLWASWGEKPVFDFTGLDDRGLYISKDYWHVRGIEVKNAGSNGICLANGGYSIVEGCVAHDNGLEGVKLTNGAHHCLILNCDAYRNYDAKNNGENADGFAAKSGIGPGNAFRGCRAWLNSDDGWDFYGCPQSITIDSCWAFRNGINLWGSSSWAGDGNAFKLGGAADTTAHTVTHSVAFDNVSKGFDQNHSKTGQTIYNCTGFRNGASNFSFYETPTAGTMKKHVLKNNVSFQGGAPSIDATATLEKNSWQGFTVTAADFQSLDTSLALAARDANYRLPNNGFLRLAANSQFINKGVDVGVPYNGASPDLGAFEYGGTAAATHAPGTIQSRIVIRAVSTAPGIVRLIAERGQPGTATISLLGPTGKTVMTSSCIVTAGRNELRLDTRRCGSGMYWCVFRTRTDELHLPVFVR